MQRSNHYDDMLRVAYEEAWDGYNYGRVPIQVLPDRPAREQMDPTPFPNERDNRYDGNEELGPSDRSHDWHNYGMTPEEIAEYKKRRDEI